MSGSITSSRITSKSPVARERERLGAGADGVDDVAALVSPRCEQPASFASSSTSSTRMYSC